LSVSVKSLNEHAQAAQFGILPVPETHVFFAVKTRIHDFAFCCSYPDIFSLPEQRAAVLAKLPLEGGRQSCAVLHREHARFVHVTLCSTCFCGAFCLLKERANFLQDVSCDFLHGI